MSPQTESLEPSIGLPKSYSDTVKDDLMTIIREKDEYSFDSSSNQSFALRNRKTDEVTETHHKESKVSKRRWAATHMGAMPTQSKNACKLINDGTECFVAYKDYGLD